MKSLYTILFSFFIHSFSIGQNPSLESAIIQSWEKHNSFHLLLLSNIKNEHLTDVSSSKGRTVAEQFAHIHDTRVAWIKEIDPEAAKTLSNAQPEDLMSVKGIELLLKKSSVAVSALLVKGIKDGKLNNYQAHPAMLFSYLLTHEAHHRGQIVLSLKQSGHPMKEQVTYAIWNWHY